MKKRKWLSLLLAVMMLVSAVPFFPVTADAADGTVEVSTWAELKKALDYTTNCSVVKVVKDIETKSLNGHTGLHQDNIIFMSMAMDKVLDLNGHTVNAYAKYYSEVAQGYLINISHKDARLTIRDSVGGGALIGEFNQEFYYEFINVSEGTLVMESGTVKMLCPSKDNQYAAIIRTVWGYSDYGSVKKLQVNMKNIRKKMGVTPGEKRYIINELGVGYRMLEDDK